MPPAQPRNETSAWYILGAGAIGCLWAAMLSRLGLNVTLLHRDVGKDTIERVKVTYTDGNRTEQFTVYLANLTSLKTAQRRIGKLLVATKSYDAVAAVDSALPLLEIDAKVITLCNGYGMHSEILDHINSALPDATFYAAASTEGALLRGPLHVEHTGHGLTLLGRIEQGQINSDNKNKAPCSNILPSKLTLKTEYDKNIELRILQKFFINCAINPLTAIHGCSNGALLSEPHAYADFCQLCKELQTIYDIAITQLPSSSDLKRELGFDLYKSASAVAKVTANNLSSMLRDYQAGRQLELRYLNCEASAMAARFGIDCPFNAAIVKRLG